MRGRRGACGVLVGKTMGKETLGRPRFRWEDNIKTDLQQIGREGAWTELICLMTLTRDELSFERDNGPSSSINCGKHLDGWGIVSFTRRNVPHGVSYTGEPRNSYQVITVTRLQAGRSGVWIPMWAKIFLFLHASSSALGSPNLLFHGYRRYVPWVKLPVSWSCLLCLARDYEWMERNFYSSYMPACMDR